MKRSIYLYPNYFESQSDKSVSSRKYFHNIFAIYFPRKYIGRYIFILFNSILCMLQKINWLKKHVKMNNKSLIKTKDTTNPKELTIEAKHEEAE